MKNGIEGMLISLAITALPVCAFAQVSIGSTVPSQPVSSNPMPTGVSTGPGSVTTPNQCISSSVTNVDFTFDNSNSPPTYTFKYTCTFTMNGSLQTVDSVVQDGSSTCLPSQSSGDCKKTALEKAENLCRTNCANDQ
jgi:hypothetical protein